MQYYINREAGNISTLSPGTVAKYKQELQQIAILHSSDINFKDFMKLYKKCTAKP